MGGQIVGWSELAPYAVPAVVLAVLSVRFWQAGFRSEAGSSREPLVGCERGTSVVEFTLVFPIMIQLLLLLVQFALMCNARLVVAQSAFSAARSAVVWLPAENDDSGNAVRNQERQVRIRRAALVAVMPISKRLEAADLRSEVVETFLESFLTGSIPNRDQWGVLGAMKEAAVVGAYVYVRSNGDEHESPRVPVFTRQGEGQMRARMKRAQLAMERYLFADLRTDVSVDDQLLPAGDSEVLSQRDTREPVTVKVRHRFGLTVPWARTLLAGSEWRGRYGFWSNLFGGRFRDSWASLVPPYRYLEDEVTLMNEGWESGHGC